MNSVKTMHTMTHRPVSKSDGGKGWLAYQGKTFLGQVLAQVLGPATKELPQLTDPGQTQRDTEQPVEDAEDPACRCFGGNVSIAFKSNSKV